MTTVPLPSTKSRSSKSSEESPDQKSELQGLVFVSLAPDASLEVPEGEDQETKPHAFSEERIGAVQIFRDTCQCQPTPALLS